MEALGYKTLACQQLIPLNIKNIVYFGTMYMKLANRMKAIDPEHYFVRLTDSIHKLRAPAFVGGNKKKALRGFEALAEAFPADEDALVNLANACT